jgi:hypothetical protein
MLSAIAIAESRSYGAPHRPSTQALRSVSRPIHRQLRHSSSISFKTFPDADLVAISLVRFEERNCLFPLGGRLALKNATELGCEIAVLLLVELESLAPTFVGYCLTDPWFSSSE